MVSGTPAVSVVMAVRDGDRYLDAALASLASQTFGDFEIVLVDNGSRDGTRRIIAEWSSREPRLRSFRIERPGLARSLVAAISLARAPLLARLDADDLAAPERLGAQHAEMARRPKLGLLGSFVALIDREGRWIGERRMALADAELRSLLQTRNPFVHSSIMMRRDAYERAGGYRKGLRLCEDFDLWCRMAEVTELGNLDRPLASYRIHGEAASVRQPYRMALVDACVVAAAAARRSGKPEPFDKGTPRLRKALALLDIERSAFRYEVLKSTTVAARLALQDNRPDVARLLRRRAFGLLGSMPIDMAIRRGVWRVLATYSRPHPQKRRLAGR